jgi:hypothetical protein
MASIRSRINSMPFRVLPYVMVVVGGKFLLHMLGWELLTINAIFTSIIGATVFLLGFLMSGVLSDYKESERLPGELAAIMATMADELEASYRIKRVPSLLEVLKETHRLSDEIYNWFHKKEKTRELMRELRSLFSRISELDGVIAPNYIVRLKQEHSNIRKVILRIHTIRETDFISSGYLIATTTATLLFVGLALTKIEPFYESLFFVGVVAYLIVFVIMLIRDLDNPFGYYDTSSHEDVSLKPFEDLRKELAERIADLVEVNPPLQAGPNAGV